MLPPQTLGSIFQQECTLLNSIQKLIDEHPNHGFLNQCYFSKYDYIKPYKEMVKSYYSSLVLPNRNNNDIVLMLRNSRIDGTFVLPDEYYTNILDEENFDKLYISLDHIDKHTLLLEKLSKYNPTIIDGKIIDVFSQITSFNKIIASQGTFSFWACFLSNADKIYWPITNDGPNSGKNSNNSVSSRAFIWCLIPTATSKLSPAKSVTFLASIIESFTEYVTSILPERTKKVSVFSL